MGCNLEVQLPHSIIHTSRFIGYTFSASDHTAYKSTSELGGHLSTSSRATCSQVISTSHPTGETPTRLILNNKGRSRPLNLTLSRAHLHTTHTTTPLLLLSPSRARKAHRSAMLLLPTIRVMQTPLEMQRTTEVDNMVQCSRSRLHSLYRSV
jgi:hypothetical protein